MENRKVFLKNIAIIVVIIGILGLLGQYQEKRESKLKIDSVTKIDGDEKKFEINNFMTGNRKEIDFQDLKSGEVNCVMGGADIDFKNAKINGVAEIELNVMMGGVKLFVPKDWTVKLDVTSIMGGVHDDKEETTSPNQNKTLIIDGTVLMGGIEVKRI